MKDSAPDKNELRRQLRAAMKKLSGDALAAASLAAQTFLREQATWKHSRAVLFFAPLPAEIDLLPLATEGLREGKTIALPRFVPETGVYGAARVTNLAGDCLPGKFNIYEPGGHCPVFPLNQLDLVLVPGVGFDVTGHRLGRGQGFYDRLLAECNGVKCGVARDEQVVAKIPAEPHDVRMNFILTPTRWIAISR